MNKIYKPAQVITLETAKTPFQMEKDNKESLIGAIQDRQPNRSFSSLLQYTTSQLESLLEFGSPHAYVTKNYVDDRNFIQGTKGRVHKGVEIEAGRDFRDWHDMKVMNQIRGYRAFKRIQMSTKDKSPQELKEDKINLILDTIDDQYKVIINHIRSVDIKELVDICLNKYEINIRKIIAALLRIRGPEFGQFPTIEEACDALGVGKKEFLSAATELQERGIYTREKLIENHEVLIDQSYNLVYTLKQNHPEFNNEITQNIIKEIPQAYGYLRESLSFVRLHKVIPLVLMVAQRHVDLSPIQILTPLMKHPDYQPQVLRDGLTSFNNLSRQYSQFKNIKFNTPNEFIVEFKELFESDDHIIARSQRYELLRRLGDKFNDQNLKLKSTCNLHGSNFVENHIHLNLLIKKEGSNMNLQLTIICGLPGEVLRSHHNKINQVLDNQPNAKITIISDKSKQSWINTTTYLGPQKYRLKPSYLTEEVEFMIINPNFETLNSVVSDWEIKNQELKHPNGSYLIISDIRPYICSNTIISNLNRSTKEALMDYTSKLIQEKSSSGQTLLKSELTNTLINYKRSLDHDKKLIVLRDKMLKEKDDWIDPIIFRHQPHLNSHVFETLKSWIEAPNIIIGSSFSNRLMYGSGGEEDIYYNIDKEKLDKDQILDYVLWKLENKTIVSPAVNDVQKLRYLPISIDIFGGIV